MESTCICNIYGKNATLLDTHTLISRGITSSILPRYLSIAVALVFTAVHQIFTRGGREVGARGKDEVLPQPDGSIVSGGTVLSERYNKKACLHECINLFPWGCGCDTTYCHFPTHLMENKSFKNEIFWSQIGFEVTDVAFPSHQRFQ